MSPSTPTTSVGPTSERDAGALGAVLLGPARQAPAAVPWRIEVADAAQLAAHRRLRSDVFVDEQGLFPDAAAEHDDADDDPRSFALVALATQGAGAGDVLGGVRLAPAGQHLTGGVDVGWWSGSRLAVARSARRRSGIGPALVRAACAHAESLGALRFEATVQQANETLFTRLGWTRVGDVTVAGAPHVAMRWPISKVGDLLATTKAPLGELLAALAPGGAGFVGDDGAPVPGSDLVAACDAIVPSLVEREPEWAGWCAVLANVNDLAAMGAAPVALLDAVAARDASFAARILAGLRRASEAYGVPLLGGHTQLGVPAALAVTALGRTDRPVPAGGGRPGMSVSLSVDLTGAWRDGHHGTQWDSSTHRRPHDLRAMTTVVAATAPAAAKDVSMAGVAGTLAMLAEASGCAAVLDVAAVPRPEQASMADWLTCFPGSGWLSADPAGRAVADVGVQGFVSTACGELVPGEGVGLRWPDGVTTTAVAGAATGLGSARGVAS